MAQHNKDLGQVGEAMNKLETLQIGYCMSNVFGILNSPERLLFSTTMHWLFDAIFACLCGTDESTSISYQLFGPTSSTAPARTGLQPPVPIV